MPSERGEVTLQSPRALVEVLSPMKTPLQKMSSWWHEPQRMMVILMMTMTMTKRWGLLVAVLPRRGSTEFSSAEAIHRRQT
jgi:hypothetical protein